ncbi:MAG: ABC transporter permease [Deltaproteobacteria bacterium]|jgi:spermidine/putrescine transport system permease protein|nr:ABC transporter permease [Deltaproteobacteria bacterium]
MDRRFPLGRIFTVTAYAAVIFLYLPSLAVIVFSVNDTRFGLSWKGFTLEWYRRLAHDPYILDAAWNSLIVAGVSTLTATVLGTGLALGLARLKKPGMLDFFVNLPIVVPDIIMAVALALAFSLMRAFSSVFEMGMFTLILGHVTFQISFVTLTVRSRLATMDKEMDLAARDLNARPYYAFTRLTLPLLAPAIVAGAMIAFTLSLDDFIISFFTHGPDSVTLPIFIYASVKRGITPEIHALSTLMLVATVVLILLAERASRAINRIGRDRAKKAMEMAAAELSVAEHPLR